MLSGLESMWDFVVGFYYYFNGIPNICKMTLDNKYLQLTARQTLILKLYAVKLLRKILRIFPGLNFFRHTWTTLKVKIEFKQNFYGINCPQLELKIIFVHKKFL